MKTLKVIGGSDIPSIISNIFAKILRNGLAERYSFKGHKGKTPFKDLFNLVNLIKSKLLNKHFFHLDLTFNNVILNNSLFRCCQSAQAPKHG